MKINEVAEILRGGARRIISRATPPCGQELAGNYCSHAHYTREFLFVISGESHYLCNDSVYPCAPGTLFLIDSELSHGHLYTKEDHHLIHLWGFLSPQNLYVSVLNITDHGQCHHMQDFPLLKISEELHLAAKKRWDLLAQKARPTEENVEHYMKTPINAVLDEVAFQLTEQNSMPQNQSLMEDMKEYILAWNGRDCSLENLAALSGYTRCYFAHKFRETFGLTLGKFIDEVRLKYVQSALKRHIHQKEMAYELGFSSPASFWNWLQKHKKELGLDENQRCSGKRS